MREVEVAWRCLIALLAVGLALAGVTSFAHARNGAAAPTRPTSPQDLKPYDVLERHCARCHQAGVTTRSQPAAGLGNILRLDEIAHEPHLVRPGNPDGSRLYTMMLGRRMPYDVYHDNAPREAPSADDIGVIRAWIAALPTGPRRSCGSRPLVSDDALHIAIARDSASQPAGKAPRVRYLSLANLWNSCAGPDYLDAAARVASVLVNGLSRSDKPVRAEPVTLAAVDKRVAKTSATPVAVRVDIEEIGWTAADWDTLARLSPYALPGLTPAAQSVRLDWLAFLLADDTSKRMTPSVAAPARPAIKRLYEPDAGLAKIRVIGSDAFKGTLASAGIEPAPTFDNVAMTDLLARHYARDVDLDRVAAELGVDASSLLARLDSGPSEATRLALLLGQGGLPRATLEPLFRAVASHLQGKEALEATDTVGAASLSRRVSPSWLPPEIEIVSGKARYAIGDTASVTVRSEVDCHLTLVSVSPKGSAVVLLPNDWDRNTFLPGGKEQVFPRPDSPFRLRLDSPGWETIVAGCNPAGEVFDGIQHDFNLEKFTTLGDYDGFLLRMSGGLPMLVSGVPPGEKRAAPKRQAPPPPAKVTRGDARKPGAGDPVARSAVRFEVR